MFLYQTKTLKRYLINPEQLQRSLQDARSEVSSLTQQVALLERRLSDARASLKAKEDAAKLAVLYAKALANIFSTSEPVRVTLPSTPRPSIDPSKLTQVEIQQRIDNCIAALPRNIQELEVAYDTDGNNRSKRRPTTTITATTGARADQEDRVRHAAGTEREKEG